MAEGINKRTTFWKCAVCGKLTAGRLPRDGRLKGDGTFWYPRRHDVNGEPCKGNLEEAECVETPKDGKYNW